MENLTNMELVGWAGSFLFAVCGLPQMIQCVRDGHAKGLSLAFLTAWVMGEILTLIYVLPGRDLPLISNYVFNLIVVGIMLRYKLFPRE